ncbi:MAG TPA: MFS transporter [Acidimicrobiia bacterium]|nr:MFS transporter [Acidimicrobiia bacterium]
MWADRDVRRVVLARFISRTGGEAAFFVGIWGKAAFEMEASAAGVAAVMAALGVASLIGSAAAGVLVDRFDPRRVLIACEIIFIPVAIGMVFAETLQTLVIATFLLGLVGMPVFTAISAFGPFLTEDPERLARINGYIEGASWAAFVVGPALGAIIAGSVGLDGIFVLDAVTSAVAALIIVPVKVRKMAREEKEREGFRELREGFSYAYGHRRLRFYVWLGSSVWVLFGTFSALEPLFYRDILQVEPETLGWVNSIFGLGLVAGTVISARLPARYRTARTLVLMVALNSLGVLAYVGTDQLKVVVVAGVFWGLLIGAMAPLLRTLIQLNTPEALMGRITGVTQVHSEVGHLLPLAIAPFLAGVFGVQRTLIYTGLALAVFAMLFVPMATRLDRTRTVDVPPTGLPDPSDEPRSVGH